MCEASESIVLSRELNWEQAKQIYRLLLPWPKRVMIHSVVVLVIFVGIVVFRPPYPIGPLVLGGCVVAYFHFSYRLRRNAFNRNCDVPLSIQFDTAKIDTAKITVRSQGQLSEFQWSVFKSCSGNDQGFVLRGDQSGGTPCVAVLRAWSKSDEEWHRLQELVARHFPGLATTYTTEQARTIRIDKLNDERSLKQLVVLSLAMWMALGIVPLIASKNSGLLAGPARLQLLNVFILVLLAVACVLTCGAVRLASWVRVPLIAFSVLCLPLFPFGTILGFRLLHLLSAGSEPQLLTPKHMQIVHSTRRTELPKARTPALTWFILVLVVLVLVLAGVVSLIPSEVRQNG